MATFATLTGSVANTLLVLLQGVLLIPLYTHYVGPHLYGAWLGSGDVLVWLQALDLGLPNLMIQRVGAAYGRSDEATVAAWFASSIFALACIGLVVSVAGIGISSAIAAFLGLHGHDAIELQRSFALASAVTGILVLNNGFIGFSRAVQRTWLLNGVGVAAGVAGLVSSFVLVLHGYGLLSIPIGMAVRALISVLGGICFSAEFFFARYRRINLKVKMALLREMLLISPITALSTLGYALMNQSETLVAAKIFGPEVAVSFNLTKKAADLCRSFADTVGFASYGAFAHLVTSAQRVKALAIHSELNSLRTSGAILLAAAYMALNHSLVAAWVGPQFYAGSLLTILIGLHMIVVGGSYLANYLYRASGHIVKGSLALIVECALRVPLIVLLAYWVHLPGVLMAGIGVGSLSWLLVHRWTTQSLGSFATITAPTPLRVWIVRLAVFASGALLCLLYPGGQLLPGLGLATLVTCGGAAALLWSDVHLRHTLSTSLENLSLYRKTVAVGC